MPVQRIPISTSQLAELIEVDPKRVIGIEPDQVKREGQPRDKARWWIVLEPPDEADSAR